MKHIITAALVMCAPVYADENTIPTYDAYMARYVPDRKTVLTAPLYCRFYVSEFPGGSMR